MCENGIQQEEGRKRTGESRERSTAKQDQAEQDFDWAAVKMDTES